MKNLTAAQVAIIEEIAVAEYQLTLAEQQYNADMAELDAMDDPDERLYEARDEELVEAQLRHKAAVTALIAVEKRLAEPTPPRIQWMGRRIAAGMAYAAEHGGHAADDIPALLAQEAAAYWEEWNRVPDPHDF